MVIDKFVTDGTKSLVMQFQLNIHAFRFVENLKLVIFLFQKLESQQLLRI